MGSLRVYEAKADWRRHVLPALLIIVAGFAVHGLWVAANMSAAGGGPVGYVDVGRLIDDYLAPVVDGPLTEETLRLQSEFEDAVRRLDPDQTEEMFERYQAMLNSVKHDLIEAQLPLINEAIGAVAEREAVTVVLDKQSILHGGVDLTDAVLRYLRGGHDGDEQR